MAENSTSLLQDAQAYVTDLLPSKLNKSIRFHTLQHTQEVVAACEKLADHYQLPEEDRLPLYLAAWFHDTGYIAGRAQDHESVSIQQATDFLQKHGVNEQLKNHVMNAINATRMPQSPTTTIERILCDADLFHLGTDAFKEKNRLLRDELNEFGGEDVSKKEWRKRNIEFLQAHKYFTTFGREKLQPAKEVHLYELKDKNKDEILLRPDKDKKDKAKDIKDMKDKDKITLAAEQAAEAKKKKDKEKEKETERGVQTVFRIMAQTQNNLSQMADNKANILISVNAIVLSVVISALVPKLESNTHLVIPVLLLVVVCVTVIVMAILATRPNITGGTFTKEEIASKKANLLFFGNFYKMSLPDYDWGMSEMLSDKSYLYASVVKDSYFLGVVLAKKYRQLRIAYNIFMYGLIIVIIAFALSFIIPQPVEVYQAG